jgi:hypothetical protein
MKVSLIEICDCCGQQTGGELLEERFQDWAWQQGEFMARLCTLAVDGKRLIFELKLKIDERDKIVASL